MSRLFSIIVTLFILVLVYLWVGYISDRDETPGKPATSTTTSVDPRPFSQDQDEDKESISLDAEDEATEEANSPGTVTPEPTKQPEKPVASGGSHLVIVGNFLERVNAEKHLETVKSLGFPSSEILQFEISQYYTVCAGRYNDPTEARRVAKRIKEQHGIDAYMRTVN